MYEREGKGVVERRKGCRKEKEGLQEREEKNGSCRDKRCCTDKEGV
jgi:hypothetical protein